MYSLVPHRIILCYNASYHITSHHIASHHITSPHISSHNITSHNITSHHITSHNISLHLITSHHITSHALKAALSGVIVQGIPTVSRAVINEELGPKGNKTYYLLGQNLLSFFSSFLHPLFFLLSSTIPPFLSPPHFLHSSHISFFPLCLVSSFNLSLYLPLRLLSSFLQFFYTSHLLRFFPRLSEYQNNIIRFQINFCIIFSYLPLKILSHNKQFYLLHFNTQ